ncbi:Copper amine oxidase N-terminal domain-containing protein [Paenibacillus sp. CF095]|uniref:N-acetylmuramoyl-L-alanine amidase n=1 Tax=Paenibacillus sp. CF095 TaxID=1881033 RepID=UPI00089118EC|nr:N-acetylmuramoyl-L-alanine amidase [Paenibacillus sp. CF095]SDC86614.1 Copper amine oxidase N-terminal domain-containing protein [Paenibacillus sp. CF095]
MNYRKDYIPKGTAFNRRPAHVMNATTITIHNTGNANSTAANERAWLTNPTNARQASFHIVVDEREAIECIPLNENAWHSGDGSGASSGNRTSIGIEICESGNYAKTLDSAATLVASMLKERGWGVDRLRRHYDWSGKICPRLMYDGGAWTGWGLFKAAVAAKLNEGKADADVKKDVIVSVVVNGKKVTDGVLDGGTTYTPARAVAEALGAKVTWDAKTKTVTITKEAK